MAPFIFLIGFIGGIGKDWPESLLGCEGAGRDHKQDVEDGWTDNGAWKERKEIYFNLDEIDWPNFRVGATFEVRTVLYKICLFNDKMIMHDRVYIQNQKLRGDNITAERQKESVCERQSIAENER